MYAFCANLQNDIFTFTLEDAHKENSIPATSYAKSKGQSLLDAKKHDSKRDDTLKQESAFNFSSADESESFRKSLLQVKHLHIHPLNSCLRCFNESEGLAFHTRNCCSKLGSFMLSKYYSIFMLCHARTAEFNFNLDHPHNLKPAGIIFWTSLIQVMRRKP